MCSRYFVEVYHESNVIPEISGNVIESRRSGNLQVSIVMPKCIMEGYPPVPNGYVRAGSRSATVCKHTLKLWKTLLIQ